MRLLTRNGHDFTERYPLIAQPALSNRSISFVIDGDAVLLGVDGVSDCDGMHSRQHDDEVQLYAFDALMLDGDDLRKLPLAMRKTNPAGSSRATLLLSKGLPGYWPGAGKASSSAILSKGRSRPTYFAKPANSG